MTSAFMLQPHTQVFPHSLPHSIAANLKIHPPRRNGHLLRTFKKPPDSSTGFALVAHHRQRHGILDEEYYVLCDSDDWASDSGTILAVCLDFGGYVDAVRMQVGVASDSIPSMSIANTDWEESLEGDRWPKEKFAVYITAKDGNVDGDTLVKALNAGLAGRKA